MTMPPPDFNSPDDPLTRVWMDEHDRRVGFAECPDRDGRYEIHLEAAAA